MNRQNDVKISVIIPSYKPNKEFHQCLRALLEQRTEVDFEIIVADSSPDDIQEIYQKSFPQVKFYRKQIKTLPGTARNFGVTKAKGKLLAFTDTDCVVDSNWLNKILEAHQNRHKAICGSIENGYPENFISQAEYLMEFGDFLPERESGIVPFAPSCNFSISRELYNKIAGFENVITSEDDLFCHKLQQAKEKIYFDNKIKLVHFQRTQMKKFLLKQKEFGIGFYLTRKTYKIRGYQLTKNKLFALTILPIRIILIWRKVLRNSYKYLFNLIITTPIIILGLIYYSYGFWKAFDMDKQLMNKEF